MRQQSKAGSFQFVHSLIMLNRAKNRHKTYGDRIFLLELAWRSDVLRWAFRYKKTTIDRRKDRSRVVGVDNLKDTIAGSESS